MCVWAQNSERMLCRFERLMHEIFSQQKVEKNVLNLRISGVDKGVLAPDRQYILSKGQKTWVKG